MQTLLLTITIYDRDEALNYMRQFKKIWPENVFYLQKNTLTYSVKIWGKDYLSA